MLRSVTRAFAVDSKAAAAAKAVFAKKEPLLGVGRVIMTASCKGGVGKSTVALNTAITLSEMGKRVGLFDADLYGPSVPKMVSTEDNRLQLVQEKTFLPISAYGIETVSVGNGIGKNEALLWKGPAIGSLITELLRGSMWSGLDYLIIDTPPGTGDVQMSLHQTVPIDGAVIVTSPQEVALADVRRNIDMFKKMNIPILGIIQNMDGYVCPCCNKITKIFPGKGGEDLAKQCSLDFLGSIPIDPSIGEAADEGFPAVLRKPNSKYAQMFREIAKRIISRVPPKEDKK